jgi:hypothetical protein
MAMSFRSISAAQLFAAMGVLSLGRLGAQAPQVVPLNPPQLWQRAEFRVTGAPPAANNFDPDLIRLDATITAPSGRSLTVPAFWYQNFTRALAGGAEVLTPAGAPEWRIRFTPTEPGEYTLSLTIQLNGAAAGPPVVTLFALSTAAPAAAPGWVRIAPGRRDFETSDGRPLRLVGANVCWAEKRGTFDYDQWFGAMHQAGENFARLWMSPWWAGLEHRAGTLNNYDLKGAWELDHIFQLAEREGIYLLFCFDHHGMFQVDNRNWGGSNNFWKVNPYSAALGGPCAQPNDFFTNPQARAIYQKRLRYLVARYGSSPYLLAWQFFNEIDNVFAPGPLKGDDVIAWHREMGRWMHAHDPYHHLVTTSLTGGSDRPEVWTVPELDFACYHSYNEAATIRGLPALARSFLQRYGKPVLIGEFGINARGWDIAADPALRGLRQGLWGGALGGAVGSAMSWWWQDLDADNVYPLYAAMTGILRRAGWYEGSWTPVALAGPGTPPTELAGVTPDGDLFDAQLALNAAWRADPADEYAVANPLAAQRSAEYLSAYLQGTAHAERQRPIRLAAWFGDKAKLILHVNSVAADAELVVRVDGAEALRTAIGDRDGLAQVNKEIDQDFAVEIAPGKHRVEIANTGRDWIFLDSIRLEHVRTADFAGGWKYGPEAAGLRNGEKAVLYVCSPWVVFPAGAHRFNPPLLTSPTVTLTDWPAGRFQVQWFDPRTGVAAGTAEGVTSDHSLTLPLPGFRDDLAGIVTPVATESSSK